MGSDALPRAAGFFVLRTPLLPFDTVEAWGRIPEGTGNEAAAGTEAAAWAERRDEHAARMWRLAARPEVREALYFASPEFESRLPPPGTGPGRRPAAKVERALARFVFRFVGRPTPLGMSAGWSTGRVADETSLALPDRRRHVRRTRVRLDVLTAWVDRLLDDERVGPTAPLVPNSTLYRLAGQIRYLEGETTGDGTSYFPVSVDRVGWVEAILRGAVPGADVASVATALVEALPSLARERAMQLVADCRRHQVLVPGWQPPVTCDDPVAVLLDDLRPREPAADTIRTWDGIRSTMSALDREGTGIDPGRFREVGRRLQAAGAPATDGPFQADLLKPVDGLTLGSAVVHEILRGVEWLRRWVTPTQVDEFAEFRAAFRARFGDREVPLAEALDEDLGIPFGPRPPIAEMSPLLASLDFPGSADPPRPWDPRHELLLPRVVAAATAGETTVAVRPDDLESRPEDDALPLPSTFAVKGSLAAASPAALRAGDFRFALHGAVSPGSGLLGRLARSDPELREALASFLSETEAAGEGAVTAEVVCSPAGVGRVGQRPVLSRYEIPYLGRSTLPRDRQIPLEDLRVSVQDGTVQLRSVRLGRRVLPRLSAAHDFRRADLPIYRFLGALPGQGVARRLRWEWGPLSSLPFLPRIALDRVVLAPAAWTLGADELRRVCGEDGHGSARNFSRLREERRIPRYAFVVDGGERHLYDFENALGLVAFLHFARHRSSVVLEEMFPAPDDLLVAGPDGGYVHDLIVPFRGPGPGPRPARPRPAVARPSVHLPGSDWLYLKIYTGPVTADVLLREVLAPFTRSLDSEVRRWFFLRHADPDPHLRIRFEGTPAFLHSRLLPDLMARLDARRDQGQLWRVAVDTYDREVNRYGGEAGLRSAEGVFHADSTCALEILEQCRGPDGPDRRWRLALRGIDELCRAFDLDLASRARVLGGLRGAFGREFAADRGPLKHRLGMRFRREREALESLLDGEGSGDPPLAEALRALADRSRALRSVRRDLPAELADAGAGSGRERWIANLIHLQCNRLLRWPSRAEEMVLYDFLGRLYDGRLARGEPEDDRG